MVKIVKTIKSFLKYPCSFCGEQTDNFQVYYIDSEKNLRMKLLICDKCFEKLQEEKWILKAKEQNKEERVEYPQEVKIIFSKKGG